MFHSTYRGAVSNLGDNATSQALQVEAGGETFGGDGELHGVRRRDSYSVQRRRPRYQWPTVLLDRCRAVISISIDLGRAIAQGVAAYDLLVAPLYPRRA